MSIAKRTLRDDTIPACRLARVNILNPIVNWTKLPTLPIEEAKVGYSLTFFELPGIVLEADRGSRSQR